MCVIFVLLKNWILKVFFEKIVWIYYGDVGGKKINKIDKIS